MKHVTSATKSEVEKINSLRDKIPGFQFMPDVSVLNLTQEEYALHSEYTQSFEEASKYHFETLYNAYRFAEGAIRYAQGCKHEIRAELTELYELLEDVVHAHSEKYWS